MHTPVQSDQTFAQAEIPWWRSAAVLAVGLAVVALCVLQGRPQSSSEAGVVLNLPYRVDGYRGFREEPSPAEKKILPPDTLIERKEYTNFSGGDKIVCSVVLSGIERRSIHRPDVCLPSQGWTIRSRSTVTVPLASGKKMDVKRFLLEREIITGPGKRMKINSLFYYWFVGKSMTTAEHWERILYSSWDLMVHNINHRWAYVIVSSIVTGSVDPNGRSIQETDAMLQKFIHDAVPSFQLSEMPPEAVEAARTSQANK